MQFVPFRDNGLISRNLLSRLLAEVKIDRGGNIIGFWYQYRRSWLHWCCGQRMIRLIPMWKDSDVVYGVDPEFVCLKCETHYREQ